MFMLSHDVAIDDSFDRKKGSQWHMLIVLIVAVVLLRRFQLSLLRVIIMITMKIDCLFIRLL
jgi:hypothetical protein